MARPETVSASDLTERIAGVFRSRGYEGASLNELSQASGLAKAALYHRFAEGKPAMALSVLKASEQRFDETVLAVLQGEGSVSERLEAMSEAVSRFYAAGGNSCLIDLFSLSGTPDGVRRQVATGAAAWLAALASVLQEAGFDRDEAQSRAEDAVIRIQGALVLSRALADPAPFRRQIATLPTVLLASQLS